MILALDRLPAGGLAEDRLAVVDLARELTLPPVAVRELRLLRPESFLAFCEEPDSLHLVLDLGAARRLVPVLELGKWAVRLAVRNEPC